VFSSLKSIATMQLLKLEPVALRNSQNLAQLRDFERNNLKILTF